MSENNTLDKSMVVALVEQIVALKQNGHAVVLVSSGAVGAGRGLWLSQHKNAHFSDPVIGKQVLASLGQANLIHTYNDALQKHGMLAAQLLMTKYDFRQRRHFVNVAHLIEELLQQKTVLPIVNENDSLSVDELMFTDNDQLSGLVAAQINADRLILLTNVDGVYDPETGAVIREMNPSSGAWPKIGAQASAGGRGGMVSKLDTVRKMARAGVTCHIAPARKKSILLRLVKGEDIGTKIIPARKAGGKKRWLAVHLEEPRGAIIVNECLVERLKESDKVLSILPIGISEISGSFEKGDVVEILDEGRKRIGFGQARYGADVLGGYIGRNNQPVFIHYDALHLEVL
ncbi:MAG: glutamate 5-kinase [Rhodospirillales bacterium]|nr:glutamate 5-kinase [Rhodospirillales bacterium]